VDTPRQLGRRHSWHGQPRRRSLSQSRPTFSSNRAAPASSNAVPSIGGGRSLPDFPPGPFLTDRSAGAPADGRRDGKNPPPFCSPPGDLAPPVSRKNPYVCR
jgi:hypothetical protein